MEELRLILSFILIMAFCMIICSVAGWLVLVLWKDVNAAWSVFFFGTLILMLVLGQLD